MATYVKRGKTWEAQLHLGKDNDGKPLRPYKSGFRTKNEAELWASEVMLQHDKGINILNSKMLLKDFMKKWHDEVCSKKGINTSYNNLSRMNAHIIPKIGHVPLDKLTVSVVQDFYLKLGEEGLAVSSKKKIMETLSNAMRYAIKLKLISYLPTDIEHDPGIRPKLVYWTEEELFQFLDFVKGISLYLPVLILSFTGMRPGEMMGLQWKKIDLKNGLMYIDAQVVKDKASKGIILTDIVKTESSERVITLPKILIEALKGHKEDADRNRPNDFVLTNSVGEIAFYDVTRVMFSRYIDKLRKKQTIELLKQDIQKDEIDNMLIKKIPLYNLRHTHATMLLNNGENIKVISERLGHKSIKTTLDTYASIMPKTRTHTANLLDNIYSKISEKPIVPSNAPVKL